MLIFPNLADERGDKVTAIVRSGWGHATGCVVFTERPNLANKDARKNTRVLSFI